MLRTKNLLLRFSLLAFGLTNGLSNIVLASSDSIDHSSNRSMDHSSGGHSSSSSSSGGSSSSSSGGNPPSCTGASSKNCPPPPPPKPPVQAQAAKIQEPKTRHVRVSPAFYLDLDWGKEVVNMTPSTSVTDSTGKKSDLLFPVMSEVDLRTHNTIILS